MFKECINSTPFSSEAADAYFSNITGDSYNGDVSFLSTMRAILGSRIPKDESLHLSFKNTVCKGFSESQAADFNIRSIVDYIYPDTTGRIYIHGVRNTTGDPDVIGRYFNSISDKFPAEYAGYVKVEKVTSMFLKSFATLCFTNAEKKCTVVFIANPDIRKIHFIQCAIAGIASFYCKGSTYTDDEKSLMMSVMGEGNYRQYIDILKEMAKPYNFREAIIKKLLEGFEVSFDRDELDRVRYEITEQNNQIEEYNRLIGDILRRLEELNISCIGLETKINRGETDTAMQDFFLSHKNYELRRVADHEVQFVIRGYISNFDNDAAENYINNSYSFLYTRSGDISKSDMKRLMKAIFVDENLRIRTCAAYTLKLRGNVQAHAGFNYGDDYLDCMPNPHIDGYHCMGNYSQAINKMLTSRNYIGAMEQCAASAMSLNWHDSTVMDRFVRIIQGEEDVNNHAIELPDGSVVTPKEAVEWLKAQDEAHE